MGIGCLSRPARRSTAGRFGRIGLAVAAGVLSVLVAGCPSEVPYETPQEAEPASSETPASPDETSRSGEAPPFEPPTESSVASDPTAPTRPTGRAPWEAAETDVEPPAEASDLFRLAQRPDDQTDAAPDDPPSEQPEVAEVEQEETEDGFAAFLAEQYADLPVSDRKSPEREKQAPAREVTSESPRVESSRPASQDAEPAQAKDPVAEALPPAPESAGADAFEALMRETVADIGAPTGAASAVDSNTSRPDESAPPQAEEPTMPAAEPDLPGWLSDATPAPDIATAPEPDSDEQPPVIKTLADGNEPPAPDSSDPAAEPATPATTLADTATEDRPRSAPELPEDFGAPPPARAATPTDRAAVDTPAARVASATPAGRPAPGAAKREPLPSVPVLPTNTRHVAWLYGAKLGLAELADLDGATPQEVAAWDVEVERLSKELGVGRPASVRETADTAARVADLIQAAGSIGGELAIRHGADHAALFEIAVKTNALLVVADERPDLAGPVAAAIRDAAGRARLPEYVWGEVAGALERDPTADSASEAVMKLHRRVESYLR